MNRWRCAAVVIGLFATQQVIAEPISVISGEHETFTRLVMELPENSEWQITTDVGKSILKFDGFDDGFDLTRAFSIIPRTRLKSLVARGSELEMQLACDCPIQSYVEQGRFLVLDITDGLALEANDRPTARSQEVPSSEFGIEDLLWSQSEIAMNTARETNEAQNDQQQSDREVTNSAMREALAETQKQLLQAFSNAASRDIISLQDGLDIQTVENEDAAAESGIFDSSNAQVTNPDINRSNLRVTNSRDLPKGSEDITNISGATCPSADIVDISAWSETNDFNKNLAQSNARLFDEAGRLDRSEILKRARMYIYFGFGAEARQTLAMESDVSANHPELIDLARILEEGSTKAPHYLHQFADCDSDLALWSILADQTVQADMPINPRAALRALKKLPTHLQFFLAESLADRLVQFGDAENAQKAVRIFENLEENVEDTALLVTAQIEQKTEKSREILTDLSAQNHMQTPAAVVQLVDHHIENDMPVSADIALLAEAFATEMRNSDQGHRVLRAFVLAAIKSSQFEKAYAALNSDRVKQHAGLRNELVSYYFMETAKVSDDASFLDGVFHQLPSKQSFVDSSVLKKIGSRLMEIGFTAEAKEILQFVSQSHPATDLSLLNARLALIEKNFEASLRYLAGLESQEADLIRGEAFQALQQPESAAYAYRRAQNEGLAMSALWQSDQWANHIESDHPRYGPIQKISSDERTEVENGQNMLASAREQIDASIAARQVLEVLLQDLTIPN